MEHALDGKRALVLGASQGIGYGIAHAMVRAGAGVAITSRDEARARHATEKLGHESVGYACDTGSIEQVEALHATVLDGLGAPEILVLNSGGPPPGGAMGVSPENWRQAFEFMFVGLVRIADLFLPAMIEGGYGRILMIASSGSVEPIPNLAVSNAVRPALIAWGKTLANEVSRHGVTVNTILPGRIETDRLRKLDAGNAERHGVGLDEIVARSHARIPAGRYGRVDELGAVATFLASPQASYVTGSMIRVDGGMIAATG